MKSDIQLGLGEGPIKKVGSMSQPRGAIDTVSCTLTHTHAMMCFLGQLYSRQLRVSRVLIYRGAVTRRARSLLKMSSCVGNPVRTPCLCPLVGQQDDRNNCNWFPSTYRACLTSGIIRELAFPSKVIGLCTQWLEVSWIIMFLFTKLMFSKYIFLNKYPYRI